MAKLSKIIVLGGDIWILCLRCLLHVGLLLSHTLVQLILQDGQLHLELFNLLLVSVKLLLLVDLILELQELSYESRQGAILLLVYLPFERKHSLLEVHVILAVFLFLLIGSVHFGLK